MKKFSVYLVLAYAAMTAQALIFKSIRPDIVLVLVSIYALKYGYKKGLAYGALCGLISDTLSGFIIGPNIISKLTAVFLARTARESMFNWTIFANTLLIAVLSVIDIFVVHVCLETFTGVSFVNRPWKMSIIGFVLTVLCALAMYRYFGPYEYRVADED